jgi:hypothetical protein
MGEKERKIAAIEKNEPENIPGIWPIKNSLNGFLEYPGHPANVATAFMSAELKSE